MQAQEILKQYQNLRRVMPEAKLPALENMAYCLKTESKTLEDIDAVCKYLHDFNPITGWLDYQSGKQYFMTPPLTISQDYDKLLNAEVANDENSSLHIRYNGNGGWIVTQYDYGKGENERYLVDQVEHHASFDKNGKTTLQYLRFWTVQDTTLGMTPVFACFIGFGGTQ